MASVFGRISRVSRLASSRVAPSIAEKALHAVENPEEQIQVGAAAALHGQLHDLATFTEPAL
jgi:hypothetical protein